MSEVPVIDADAVYAAVDLAEAIDRTRVAFERHANGEWAMPPKVYLDSPPYGDFRAMPARGDGFALLKWVTSFPRNSERGLPVVTGALLLSDAATGELKAIMDCAAVTSLRTGAAAAVSALVLAPEAARTVGVVGCGVNGTWSARSLATAGYGPGVCADEHPEAAHGLAAELGWRAGDRAEAAQQDVVVTVTRGDAPVILASDLRPGQHLAALGADALGKAEIELAAIERCRLFCDEWEQASGGGELSGAVSSGLVTRDEVTQLGDVIAGRADGRQSREDITFSTRRAWRSRTSASRLRSTKRGGRAEWRLAPQRSSAVADARLVIELAHSRLQPPNAVDLARRRATDASVRCTCPGSNRICACVKRSEVSPAAVWTWSRRRSFVC